MIFPNSFSHQKNSKISIFAALRNIFAKNQSLAISLCLSEEMYVVMWLIAVSLPSRQTQRQQSFLKLSLILWNTMEYVFVFQKTMV